MKINLEPRRLPSKINQKLKAEHGKPASVIALVIATLSVALLASALITTARAEDWPQFRGPNGSGVSAATIAIPEEFGPAKNVIWKTPLPFGHSSPVLTKDRIFVTAYSKQQTADSKQPVANSAQQPANSRDEAKEREKEKNNYKLLVICHTVRLEKNFGNVKCRARAPVACRT